LKDLARKGVKEIYSFKYLNCILEAVEGVLFNFPLSQ